MHFAKVHLRNNGLKGLKVKYAKVVERDGQKTNDEFDRRTGTPIGPKIRTRFDSLKEFFVEICGLNNIVIDDDRISISGIESNEHDGFKLIATVSTDVTSYKIDHQMVDESYNRYKEVMKIIAEIYDAVAEYIKKGDHVEPELFMHEYQNSNLKGSKKVADLDFSTMDKKELQELYRTALEDIGAIVMMPEDMGDQPKEDKKEKQQLKVA